MAFVKDLMCRDLQEHEAWGKEHGAWSKELGALGVDHVVWGEEEALVVAEDSMQVMVSGIKIRDRLVRGLSCLN